ncbi:hypothetical protein V6N13_102310 [Hibiscus sabdariffa]|uniref:Uncharacterized protein n=1 Tax=Hibiscus sabdariffa TaxID=183260 RepID=A0ABR2D4E9_9ROSI
MNHCHVRDSTWKPCQTFSYPLNVSSYHTSGPPAYPMHAPATLILTIPSLAVFLSYDACMEMLNCTGYKADKRLRRDVDCRHDIKQSTNQTTPDGY